jgi:hypothetical protein
MKKIIKIAGKAGAKLRDRSRSVKLRVLDIARAARSKAKQSQEKLKRAYGQLLNSTSRVVGQAKRFSTEVATGVKRSTVVLKQLALENLGCQIDAMVPLVRQVMKQTRARILRGDTRADGKILSLFEPATEVIRKGKAGKPNEFGKMVKLQEAENQIVTDYEVYDRRPSDGPADRSRRSPSGKARTHSAPGCRRCRILLRQERGGGEGKGRQALLRSQSLHQERGAQTLVPQRPEMADRMRGAHQRRQTATRAQPVPL